MSLFKLLSKPDRQETQLAYEASYYPAHHLQPQHKIAWSAARYYSKQKLEDRIVEGKLHTSHDGIFGLHWQYNNVPTEIEWDKLHPDTMFLVHLRISPLIKTNSGKVAVLGVI